MAAQRRTAKPRPSRRTSTNTVYPLPIIDVTEFSSPLTSSAAQKHQVISTNDKDVGKSADCREQAPKNHVTIFHTISEHRPYFISYVMFAQVLVMVIVVIEYTVAPVSLHAANMTGEVLNGFGQASVAHRIEYPNPFIGPSFADLVFLGAKYSPCMRKNVIDAKTTDARTTGTKGCCLSNSVTGVQCFNSESSDCPISIGRSFETTSCYGAQCCVDPDNHPTCILRDVSSLETPLLPLCTCTIVARPCCVGMSVVRFYV